MARVKNQAPRLFSLGGVNIKPGESADVPDEIVQREAVQAFVKAGELAIEVPPKRK